MEFEVLSNGVFVRWAGSGQKRVCKGEETERSG